MNKSRSMFLCLFSAVLLSGVLSSAVFGQDSLQGAYEFTHMETPDGIQETQMGMLVVADGYICHVRTAKEREPLSQGDSEADAMAKAAALFRSANATCGSYTLAGDKITAVWQSAINPESVGNTAEFLFSRDGDTLKVAPAGAPQFAFVYRKK